MSRPSSPSWPNVPAPPGSKAGGSYSRIIPAEELGGYASWKPRDVTDVSSGASAHAPKRSERPAVRGWSAQPGLEEPRVDDSKQLRALAHKAGYEEGYRDGLIALEDFKASHAEQMQAQWNQRLQAFTTQLSAQWAALEPAMAISLADAAVALAGSVLRAELQLQPAHVLPLAQEAVSLVVGSAKRIELMVHPQDLGLVQHSLGEWLQSRGAHALADPEVARGGCLVKSDIAQVDARMATRWVQAAAVLGSERALPGPPESVTS